MRILRRGVLLAVLAAAASMPAHAARESGYASPRAAFETGLTSYRTGRYDDAIPALEFAIAHGDEQSRFFAMFYLARIYADDNGQRADKARAYELYKTLVLENFDADPDDGRHAPFVAKALIALSAYLRTGLPEIGLRPDLPRAVEWLNHAANVLNDRDAQFELAKLYLRGEGVAPDVKLALHHLSVLSQGGHPGAQAFLADLQWRGQYLPKDERRALALITLAVEAAPADERLWIEDIYQNIFCSASKNVRTEADAFVTLWKGMSMSASVAERPRPAPRAAASDHGAILPGPVELRPQRTCGDGVPINFQALRPGHDGERAQTARPVATPGAN